MQWIVVALAICANTVAALFIKMAASPDRSMPSLNPFNLALTNWPLWLGLICYGMALILYIVALATLPVSVAHPIITAGAIAAVSSSAFLFFGERITVLGIIGIILVAFGVGLIALGSDS